MHTLSFLALARIRQAVSSQVIRLNKRNDPILQEAIEDLLQIGDMLRTLQHEAEKSGVATLEIREVN